jgi:glyoxylase-like metal-dependent hydrolase (beta-lactamase superfamily II)/rhodanese-related sulfurtransferase
MRIEQLYTQCLSEAAYFIESEGEAVVIDPLRDVEKYLELAQESNSVIKYIFETHFHADFVSGHLDLSKKTGAPIVFGPEASTSYPIRQAKDGEVFHIGKISLEVLHTPGHTLESTSYLLRDAAGNPHCIFTGDTLFIGDVGRPDLSSGDLSSEELAGIMYDTLQNKILPLPDEVIVFPAHGPGSACGKNLGPGTQSTIGLQRKENYALQFQDKEAFIKAVTEGLGAAPKYFAVNARINQEGYPELDTVKATGEKPLDLESFKHWMAAEALILDTRKATEFTQGFIPGSISIGLEGRFAEWAGGLLPFDKTIILVTEPGKESESVVRLSRVGFEHLAGHLKGGYQSWVDAGEPVDMIIDIEADELLMDMPHDDKLEVLDVRRNAEFANGHLQDALNIPLNEMDDVASIAELEEDKNYYIHCAGGYRSVIAASLLKRQGIHNLRNILGGWESIRQQPKVKIVKESNVLN